jgi:hypothetical protein
MVAFTLKEMEAESMLGSKCCRKDKSMKNYFDRTGNRISDLSVCEVMPQTTAPRTPESLGGSS